MIATLGYAGIVVALAGSVALAVQGVRVHRRPELGRSALQWPVWALLGGAVLAMGSLEVGLLTHDFSIEYVARNHARATPTLFTIASGWAALEGSIVLWGLVLAGFTFSVYYRFRGGDGLTPLALVVMAGVALFFFGLMATAANPFATLDPVPADGLGPNPLLQNHILMAVHPPLLYVGFVGFTVPFAFAMSALAGRRSGSAWLEVTRRWTLIAWGFLTVGITLGALWSYAVLGWGGYWAWDPVENASFIPWLVATAFIHSSVVQRRRGMLQAWNIALVIGTFALTILGTFLTRSGVVASVHSFTQSAVGPALLAFLAVVTVAAFALFAMRAQLVASSPRLDSLASREGVFLFNNLLLALFAFVVLVGTLWPILVEAFTGDQVSVGRPFFDRAATPLAFALLLAMGIGPVTPYRVARAAVLWQRLRGPLQAGLVAVAAVVLAGARTGIDLLVVGLGAFVTSAIVRHLWTMARTREGGAGAAAWRLIRNDPGYWGGQLSHIGVVLVAVAITVSGAFATRVGDAPLSPGESVEFAGYEVAYVAPFFRSERHRDVLGATVELRRGGDVVAVLEPRLNDYPNQVQAVPTPAVRVGLVEDIYVSLTRIEGGDITLDLFRYPLQWLLWAGGLLVAAGAAVPLVLRKRRRDDVEAPAPEPAHAG